MTIYKKRPASALKWIIAIAIFVLAMTLTMSDVYGFTFPNNTASSYGSVSGQVVQGPSSNSSVNDNDLWRHANRNTGSDSYTSEGNLNCPPPGVPEPSTILLLSSGLGAMYLVRRKRTY